MPRTRTRAATSEGHPVEQPAEEKNKGGEIKKQSRR